MINNISFDKLIERKNISDYPSYIIDEIKLITINEEDSYLYGTYRYKFFKYPSDIDIEEDVRACCSQADAIDFFIRGIKLVISNISRKKYHWVLELKAGIDKRYNIDIGGLKHDILLFDVWFEPSIQQLYKKQLLDNKEYHTIMNIYNMKNPGQLEYETIKKILREHLILRWSTDEIYNEMKSLPHDGYILLQDALMTKSAVNMEIIAVINNKLMDMSNFFVLIATDKFGNETAINLPQASLDNFDDYFLEQLKEGIEKLYYSKLDYNYLKLAKRYWTYARFIKDKQIIKSLVPLMNSNIAHVSQIKSEIALMIRLLQNVTINNIPMTILKNQLSNIKLQLSGTFEISDDRQIEINNTIDRVVKNNMSASEIIDLLEPIKKYLENIINNKALKFLKKVKLAPPPQYLLPS